MRLVVIRSVQTWAHLSLDVSYSRKWWWKWWWFEFCSWFGCHMDANVIPQVFWQPGLGQRCSSERAEVLAKHKEPWHMVKTLFLLGIRMKGGPFSFSAKQTSQGAIWEPDITQSRVAEMYYCPLIVKGLLWHLWHYNESFNCRDGKSNPVGHTGIFLWVTSRLW